MLDDIFVSGIFMMETKLHSPSLSCYCCDTPVAACVLTLLCCCWSGCCRLSVDELTSTFFRRGGGVTVSPPARRLLTAEAVATVEAKRNLSRLSVAVCGALSRRYMQGPASLSRTDISVDHASRPRCHHETARFRRRCSTLAFKPENMECGDVIDTLLIIAFSAT